MTSHDLDFLVLSFATSSSCPTKSSRERTAGGVVTSSRTEPCCATTHPLRAGSVCALAPRLSALVGNNTHAHPTCKSDSVVCLYQGYGSVSQPAGRASQPHTCKSWAPRHRHADHGPQQPPSSYVVVWSFKGTEGRFAMSVGRGRAFWARDGCAHTHARTHTPARADRVPTIWEETLSWCG